MRRVGNIHDDQMHEFASAQAVNGVWRVRYKVVDVRSQPLPEG